MRRFWDERGYQVTEAELRAEYDRLNRDGENIDGLTFGQYLANCQASAGGTLTEIKNKEGESMRKTFDFGKIDYNGTGRRINRVTVEAELKDGKSGPVFSVCGDIWNGRGSDILCGGQCLDTIAEYVRSPVFLSILGMWKKYHLNDMHAGTVEQEAYLDGLKAEGWKYDYADACEKLRSVDLYEVDGYKYGHGWLYRDIPAEDLAKIRSMMA